MTSAHTTTRFMSLACEDDHGGFVIERIAQRSSPTTFLPVRVITVCPALWTHRRATPDLCPASNSRFSRHKACSQVLPPNAMYHLTEVTILPISNSLKTVSVRYLPTYQGKLTNCNRHEKQDLKFPISLLPQAYHPIEAVQALRVRLLHVLL